MTTNCKWLLPLLVFGLIACDSQDDTVEPMGEPDPDPTPIQASPGEANFSTFVAIGNSLTAGFTDNALFKTGQENSLPNIMAQQFSAAGGGAFTQPLMSDDIGGLLLGGMQLPDFGPRLFFDSSIPGPNVLDATSTTELGAPLTGTFNNMGVPGAKSFHLLAPGYGNPAGLATMPPTANPYFVRMASSPTTTILADAMAQNPTFFSLWIGGNDVLGYALSGGESNPMEANPITPEAMFSGAYNGVISTLTSGDAKGVVFNIPDVTSLAHFKTVPHNPVPLDAETAVAVNGAYAAYNAGIAQALGGLVQAMVITQEIADAEIAKRTISFSEGAGNAVVIVDEDLIDLTSLNPALVPIRQATEDDLLVLPASSFIGSLADPMNPLSVNGVAIALADKWVLTPQEQEEIQTATDAFNAIIKTAVDGAGLAFVDANALLKTLATPEGIAFDDFVLRSDLVFGGGFSLDGVHPTAKGYAFLANEAMKAIEAKYNATLPRAKAIDYPITYPQSIQ